LGSVVNGSATWAGGIFSIPDAIGFLPPIGSTG
jgi:hypothetical protein